MGITRSKIIAGIRFGSLSGISGAGLQRQNLQRGLPCPTHGSSLDSSASKGTMYRWTAGGLSGPGLQLEYTSFPARTQTFKAYNRTTPYTHSALQSAHLRRPPQRRQGGLAARGAAVAISGGWSRRHCIHYPTQGLSAFPAALSSAPRINLGPVRSVQFKTQQAQQAQVRA